MYVLKIGRGRLGDCQLSVRLGFSSGHDLRVMTMNPTQGSTLNMQNWLEILALPLLLPTT